MISSYIGRGVLLFLFLVTFSFKAFAQPILPDIIGDEQNGLVLLSWTCQYDGVKSIAVLRSADSSFNYSTIGYVKKLYKGVQAFADGHPMPGKNYYKLSIVFNSGLTWGSLHYGVYVDSIAVRKGRAMPSNEVLQKMIVTETLEKAPKPEKTSGKVKNAINPADKDRYMEVYKKEPVPVATVVDTPQPKLKFPVRHDDEEEVTVEDYIETLPVETRKKIAITYSDDTVDIDADDYIENKRPEPQKKVNVTFDDKTDVAGFVATLPKSDTRKFTVSYNVDTTEPDAGKYIEDPKKPERKHSDEPKKVTVTLKDEAAVQAYVETLPSSAKSKITVSYNVDTTSNNAKAVAEAVKNEPAIPRQKISIKFTDEMNVNAAADVKSRFIFNDAVSGNVTFNLPDDLGSHHYSIKFYDKENHVVIEIPRINTAKVILDKRNFQKKGQYRFALRKDVVNWNRGI